MRRSRLSRAWCLRSAGFEKRFEEAREKSKAANKKSAQGGLKFEAEATGWLQVLEGGGGGEGSRVEAWTAMRGSGGRRGGQGGTISWEDRGACLACLLGSCPF